MVAVIGALGLTQDYGCNLASLNFHELMRGDTSATHLCHALFEQLGVWDDLIDKDKQVTDEQIHRAFWLANVEIPRNVFYRQHFDVLNPLVIQAIMNWQIANELEKTNPSEISFIIRSDYANIFVMCAMLIGGPEYAKQAGQEIRTIVHDEGLQSYLDEMRSK